MYKMAEHTIQLELKINVTPKKSESIEKNSDISNKVEPMEIDQFGSGSEKSPVNPLGMPMDVDQDSLECNPITTENNKENLIPRNITDNFKLENSKMLRRGKKAAKKEKKKRKPLKIINKAKNKLPRTNKSKINQ